MTDFSKLNEEDIQTDGTAGSGGFKVGNPDEGVALFRLRDVIEFGTVMGEYKGKPKQKRPVLLTFELTHPRHAIRRRADNDPEDGPYTGEFIRYHEVQVRLNKSNSDKSQYMKLFNRLNFDGRVATPKGKVPSFAPFLGSGFLGEIHHNTPEGSDKTYVNLDKDGVYTIGAPKVPVTDELGAPTGEYKDVPVPEMEGDQRCFLWETGVADEVYQQMWESIAIVGEKDDGTPFKNWIQEDILSEENIALPGSRAERLFGEQAAAVAELDEAIAAEQAPAEEAAPEAEAAAPEPEAVTEPDPAPAEEKAAVKDPLAELGL